MLTPGWAQEFEDEVQLFQDSAHQKSPELNLVIGTHSWVNDATSNYQVQLTGIIYNQIVPLFE